MSKVDKLRQIVLDTETTGLSPELGHRVIEIGAMEMINRRLTGNDFHVYINPERAIDAQAVAIHGITNKFLQDKPVFNQVIDDFVRYIEGAELLIHNASFDEGFLNHEFSLAGKKYKKITQYSNVVCTLKMARAKHPSQRNTLDALCKRYNINNDDRVLHGALKDAKLLANVYLAMTGGQVSMFGDDTQMSSDMRVAHVQENKVVRSKPLKVIKASADEIAAHEELTGMLAR